MIWSLTIACFVLAMPAVIWFTPWRGHLLKLFSAAHSMFPQVFSAFDRCRFECSVQRFSDETQPNQQDQYFRVQIAGRIPTGQDNTETDVQIEILDITDGHTHPHQVFSAEPSFRNDENAEFLFITHNGVVPFKNALLANPATVAEFPCHILRFAYRGRRKLLFRAKVLQAGSGTEIVSAQTATEYVYCSDGYREVQDRRIEVLRACVELAALGLGPGPASDAIQNLWSNRIQQRSDMLISADEACNTIQTIQQRLAGATMQNAAEIVLAYGKNTDRFFAVELMLQTFGCKGVVTKEGLERMFEAATLLEIQRDRFLSIVQKMTLSMDCQIEDPSLLLGITPEMDSDLIRKRLNEEYRKWNARVTHPDIQIRLQAEQILTLISEIRSKWVKAGC